MGGCGASASAPAPAPAERTAEEKALEQLKAIFDRSANMMEAGKGDGKVQWSEYCAVVREDVALKELMAASGLENLASRETFEKLAGADEFITWDEFRTALLKKT